MCLVIKALSSHVFDPLLLQIAITEFHNYIEISVNISESLFELSNVFVIAMTHVIYLSKESFVSFDQIMLAVQKWPL